MLVLDTDVASELLRVRPDASVIRFVNDREDECYLTAITAQEMMFGALRLPAGARADDLTRAVETLTAHFVAAGRCVRLDADAAVSAASIKVSVERRGRPMSDMDVLIAGMCIANGATLVTRNTKDFTDAGLELINPWDA